jgi:hypothetical protein
LKNSYQHDKNAEINYLSELINNFGNQSNLQPDEAIKTLYARYDELEKQHLFFLRNTSQNSDYFCSIIRSLRFSLSQFHPSFSREIDRFI